MTIVIKFGRVQIGRGRLGVFPMWPGLGEVLIHSEETEERPMPEGKCVE